MQMPLDKLYSIKSNIEHDENANHVLAGLSVRSIDPTSAYIKLKEDLEETLQIIRSKLPCFVSELNLKLEADGTYQIHIQYITSEGSP